MCGDEGRKAEISPEMLRAGVDVFMRWDGSKEEPEALVAEIFLSMLERHPNSLRTIQYALQTRKLIAISNRGRSISTVSVATPM